jgi:heme/copper-type cytochrome/quinol oxidase subunit 1
MTSTESSPAAGPEIDADTGPEIEAGTGEPGGRPLAFLVRWMTSTDSKVVGRLFVAGGVLGLLATITINIILGVERVDGDTAILDSDAWSQLIDAQRLGLVFGTALPLVTGLCIALVPLQLGARALAFPRLAALGFWLWFGGLVVAGVSLARNGGTLGLDADMVDLYIASLGLMALGGLAAATSIATTVLTTRAPGMTMRRVPFFSWSALVYALCLVLMLPVLVGTVIYLFVDHRNTREAFGGNVGILEWAGWIFTQPTTFVFAIPVLGLFAELIPVAFGKRLTSRGVVYSGLTLVAVSALAAVTQVGAFNLPWAGGGFTVDDADDLERKVRDGIPWAFFNFLPVLGVLILFGAGLALAKPAKAKSANEGSDPGSGTGRVNITAAMVFVFLGAEMIFVAMIASMLHAVDDLGLQGTVFEEGVVVAVVYGIALGAMGGALYWSPKLTGRVLAAGKAAPLALLGGAGAVLASVPYMIAGFLDQPGLHQAGGLYENSDLLIWNILTLIGHALMALAVLGFVGLVLSTRTPDPDDADDVAPLNPWDSQTLEWITTSPAPADNFDDVPVVESAEPVLDLETASPSAGSASARSTGASSTSRGGA